MSFLRGRAVLVIFAALGVLALLAGRRPLFLWLLALSIAAGGELFRVARSPSTKPSSLVGLVGISVLLLIAYARGEQAPPLFPAAVAGAVGASFLEVLLRKDRTGATRAIAFTLAPVLVAGVLPAYLVALRSARQGTGLISEGVRSVSALAIMWAVAEGAMALHAWRAGAPTSDAPRMRLQRTAFSIVGGIAGAMVVASVWSDTFPWSDALVLGAAVGLCTAAGHLMSTMIVEAADASRHLRLVPLVDGLFVSAPVFFYVFRVVGR